MHTTTEVTWRRLRNLIKRRDKATCFHCSNIDENGHCDHLIPLSKGGTDSILNLVWSCGKCNTEKSAKLLNLFLEPDAVLGRKAESLPLKPQMGNVIPAFVTLIVTRAIPVLPEYKEQEWKSFVDYFDFISKMRRHHIYSWLHDTIWPISQELKLTTDRAEYATAAEKKFRSSKRKKQKHWEFFCPECNRKTRLTWDEQGTVLSAIYLCPVNHSGSIPFTRLEDMIKELRAEAAQKLQLELRPHQYVDLPDWLR